MLTLLNSNQRKKVKGFTVSLKIQIIATHGKFSVRHAMKWWAVPTLLKSFQIAAAKIPGAGDMQNVDVFRCFWNRRKRLR